MSLNAPCLGGHPVGSTNGKAGMSAACRITPKSKSCAVAVAEVRRKECATQPCASLTATSCPSSLASRSAPQCAVGSRAPNQAAVRAPGARCSRAWATAPCSSSGPDGSARRRRRCDRCVFPACSRRVPGVFPARGHMDTASVDSACRCPRRAARVLPVYPYTRVQRGYGGVRWVRRRSDPLTEHRPAGAFDQCHA